MKFLSSYEKYCNLVKEQADEPIDAAEPAAPQAQPVIEPPEQKQVNIPPEGYVNLVRMMAKALVMNIPAEDLDTLMQGGEITQENAFEMEKGLGAVIKDSEIREDNPERLENPNFKKFIDSINENTFMQKYNYILSIMKKKSPYLK